jgi:AcrR family transcriptional regulator
MEETEQDVSPDAEQRLLLAAQEEFAERGYEGATIREICRKANANVASINYYFGGKEELYIAAVKAAHTCVSSGDRDLVVPSDCPAVEKLKAFIAGMAASMHVPISPTAMKLLMREMSVPGKAAHVVVKEFIQPKALGLQKVICDLFPSLDESRVLAVGASIIGQLLFYRQNRPVAELIFGKEAMTALTLELVTEHVTRFTLAALGLGEPPYQTAVPRAATEAV